jgi:hypothetical protein
MNSESQLFDIFKDSPNLGTVKEINSGKYIFASESYSKILGFESPDQMVGLTIRDLNLSQSQWGKNRLQKWICSCKKKRQLSNTRIHF